MPLPAQVQRQLDAAAKIEANLQQQESPDTPAPTDNAASQAKTEPVEAEVTPPAPTPAPAPAPVQPQPDQRYEVLQGKYNAEVPRLHQEAKMLRERIEAQDAQIEAMKRQVQRQAEEEKPLITPQDLNDYGPEMYDFMSRVAEKVFSEKFLPVLGRMQAEIEARVIATESTVVNVAGRQKQTEEEKFYSRLAAAVPNWQEINVSAAWLQWLAEHDRLLGTNRQAVIDQALQVFDSDRIIAVFEQFIKEHMPPAPVAPKASELAKQVSPSSATATQAPAQQANQNIWTDAAISEFYKDVKLGKFKGREDEQARIEADLDAAYAEGRYRPR